MGNTPHQQLKSYVHPRLGSIRRSQTQKCIEYMVGVESEKIVEDWFSNLKKIRDQKLDQYLFLPTQYSFEKQAMCGTGGVLTLKYDDYMFCLTGQIKSRRDIKRPFQQTQLWYFLYILITIGQKMENTHSKIGDVRPSNILINQDGQIKIICLYSWPSTSDNFQLVLQTGQKGLFLSPEECNYRYKKLSDKYPQGLELNICQVFSMGLTLLETASLKDCSQLYEGDYKFNEFKIREYTDELQGKYSKQLITIIQEMIRISPDKRIKCSTIYELLQPYISKIKQFTQFTIEKTKMHELINSDRNKYKSMIKNSLANQTSKPTSKYSHRSPIKNITTNKSALLSNSTHPKQTYSQPNNQIKYHSHKLYNYNMIHSTHYLHHNLPIILNHKNNDGYFSKEYH